MSGAKTYPAGTPELLFQLVNKGENEGLVKFIRLSDCLEIVVRRLFLYFKGKSGDLLFLLAKRSLQMPQNQ